MTENTKTPFWQEKKLNELTRDEWESLCDGCGHCCLIKLENEETDEFFVTNVTCQYFDLNSCQCQKYTERTSLVPRCVNLYSGDSYESVKESLYLLPSSCAYRVLYEGNPLPEWHPLLNEGSNKDVPTVSEYAVSEEYIHPEQLNDHVIDVFFKKG